jgi:N-terminal or F0 domain of Talin-head FERM
LVMSTAVLAIPSLVELCFQSVAEHLEYNSDAIKVLPLDLTERLIAFMVDRLHPRHLVMTQTRAIKIRLIKQKRSCTFRFLLHGTVGHAIQQIYEKMEDGTVAVHHYGLFQPAGAFRRARWLQEDKSLSYYDIDPSVCLRFVVFRALFC